MYAIVRNGKGSYYTSAVFGYYCNITATDDYEIYLEKIHNQFYLVFDENKEYIIKKYIFPKESKYLDPQIILLNDNQDGWIIDEDGHGCLGILSNIDFIQNDFKIQKEFIIECKNIDANFKYEEYIEIKNDDDINDFYLVTGYLHDARIAKHERINDTIYVLFDGVWGCKIEMWFEGETDFSIESRNPEENDPYWFGCTMIIENGSIYLVDEEEMSVGEITNDYCWFRGQQLKYHIIPNE